MAAGMTANLHKQNNYSSPWSFFSHNLWEHTDLPLQTLMFLGNLSINVVYAFRVGFSALKRGGFYIRYLLRF